MDLGSGKKTKRDSGFRARYISMGEVDWSLRSGICPSQRHEYSVRTLPVSSAILQAGEVGNCGFSVYHKVCVCVCV